MKTITRNRAALDKNVTEYKSHIPFSPRPLLTPVGHSSEVASLLIFILVLHKIMFKHYII